MKVAICIICHDRFDFLLRNLKRLESENIYFLCHIDKKSKPTKDELRSLTLIKNMNLVPCEERIAVNWGGRSQVDVMLLLLRKALHLNDVERTIFISGHDYFISSVDKLLEYSHTEVLDVMRIDRKLTGNLLKRVSGFNFYDFHYLNPRAYKNNAMVSFCRFINGVSKQLTCIKNIDEVYYHGSQWMSLKTKTVKIILDFLYNNPSYYEKFKFTFGSDEVFFHTLIKKLNIEITQDYTKFDENIKINDHCYGLTYINWQSNGGGRVGGPKLLNEDDLVDIINYSDRCHFIRKIDPANANFASQLEKLIK